MVNYSPSASQKVGGGLRERRSVGSENRSVRSVRNHPEKGVRDAGVELCEDLVIYAPASDEEALLAGARALQAYKALECRDTARIDFRSDALGEPYFLEANPLAGLNPWHSDLPILAAQNGIEFTALIGMILDAGLARYGLSRSGGERERRRA